MEKPEEVFPEANRDENKPEPKTRPGEVFPEAGELATGEKEPPIKEGEVFDPDADLREILKTTTGKERDEKLKIHKGKYRYQKRGLAKMQEALKGRVWGNYDIDEEELLAESGEYSLKYGFPVEFDLETMDIVKRYGECNKNIVEFLEDFKIEDEKGPRTDTRKLFAALFLENPAGNIEIRRGPVSIYLVCSDRSDFRRAVEVSRILSGDTSGRNVDVLSGKKALKISKVLDPRLDDAVTIANLEVMEKNAEQKGLAGEAASEEVKKNLESSFLHEEQHALHALFKKGELPMVDRGFQAVVSAEDDEDATMALRSFFKEVRRYFFVNNKDEILAHATGNLSAEEVIKKLSILKGYFKSGKAYDWRTGQGKLFIDNFISALPKERHSLGEETAKDIFGERYEKITDKAVAAAIALLSSGRSPAEVRSMLSFVPLHLWPKETSKLLGGTA